MLSSRKRSLERARRARTLCIDVGLDSRLEGLGVGADDLGDLLAVLEEQEGGHGADAEFLCDVGDLVHVELEEARVGVCARHPARGCVREVPRLVRVCAPDLGLT
jgi:hypothetical protein